MKFGHLEGEQPFTYGDLLTMVINHLLNGMILQGSGDFGFIAGFLFHKSMGFVESSSAKKNRVIKGYPVNPKTMKSI